MTAGGTEEASGKKTKAKSCWKPTVSSLLPPRPVCRTLKRSACNCNRLEPPKSIARVPFSGVSPVVRILHLFLNRMSGIAVIDKEKGRQAARTRPTPQFARLHTSTHRYRVCRKGGREFEWNVTGKYEIIEFVGEGSFGQVCRARYAAPAPPGSPATVVIKRISDVFNVSRTFLTHMHLLIDSFLAIRALLMRNVA